MYTRFGLACTFRSFDRSRVCNGDTGKNQHSYIVHYVRNGRFNYCITLHFTTMIKRSHLGISIHHIGVSSQCITVMSNLC